MQDRLVRFTLFGQEFTFYSDASEEEVGAVIALLQQELEVEGPSRRSSVPSSKMLVLGCLRIAAKYVQAQRTQSRDDEKQRQRITRLIDKIASVTDAPV